MIIIVWVVLSLCFIPLYVRIWRMVQDNHSIVKAAEAILKQKEKP